MRIIRHCAGIVVILVALGLSACAGKVPREQLDNIRHIAVIGGLGDEFHGIHIGTTVFTNKSYVVNAEDWGVTAQAVEAAIAALSANATRKVSALGDKLPLTIDKASADRVLADAARLGASHLLVIRATSYDNIPTMRRGYGYHQRSFMGMEQNCIYSLLTVAVHEVSSGKELAWQWPFSITESVTCHPLGNTLPWKPAWNEYSEVEQQQIRAAILENVRSDVTRAIQRLGL